ncbi:MAG: ABC transporter permease [Chitinophagaceae bacterium]
MRTLLFILQKEFKQIFRDPAILRLIFLMPVIQLIVLPQAADYEMKNINIAITNHDNSQYSQQLIQKITASGYFNLVTYNHSYDASMKFVETDAADVILEIPTQFEQHLIKENKAELFVAINAINGVKGSLGSAYLSSIIQDYNQQIRNKLLQQPRINIMPIIEVVPMNWFNPQMNYKFFMVPGILVLLLTMIGANLTALNIVREKEIGTIEQINVTPIKKHHFILGKLIPFWVLGFVIITIGFVIAKLVYGIVPIGSFITIYTFAAVYLLAVLGLGLLISTYAATQQQAMLISFFLLMIFILLGGLYTSIESMPLWAQYITKFNPVAYFIEVMRMVVLKGSNLTDIVPQLLSILLFAVVLNSWAIYSYKKRS